MARLINNTSRIRSSFFLYPAVAVICLLAGCSPGKVIEYEPERPVFDDAAETSQAPESEAGQEDGPDQESGIEDAPAYPEWVSGTVAALYGEESELEQSQEYRDAVEANPLLRYIIIYFDFNSAVISPESQEVLLEHANYLSGQNEVDVRLEGHADQRGSSGYNLSLGERRAMAVQAFLLKNGVRRSQTAAISYGEERPAVEGSDESAYSKNRRVELIYR